MEAKNKTEKILQGKVALITGGSRGIGRAITLRLAAEGADVIINYFRKQYAAEQTAADARACGASAEIIRANVGEPEKIDAMFDFIRQKYGRLDILVNNAASGVARSVIQVDQQAWDWTMNINARAFLLCAQKAAELMPGGGRIIGISSLGSHLVLPLYSAVGVSKAALEALTRYLAVELAPRGICVNSVSASAVDTQALKVYSAASGEDESFRRSTPAGRMLQAEDVAGVVAFLCHHESEMIRGQTLVVDGGWSLCPAKNAGKTA